MAEDIVSIKGSKNGLIIYLDTQREMEEIKNSLQRRLESAKGFFQGAHFFLKPKGNDITVKQRSELETLCKEYGLIPKDIDDESEKTEDTVSQEIDGILPRELKVTNHFLEGNIRNGQRLSFNGNVILMGDVNPGGYIAATGNIIILGSLMGIAHAGIEGDLDVFVMAYDFKPHQIRIGYTVARNPDNSPLSLGGPEIAHLEEGKIIIDKYPLKKNKVKVS